LNKKESIEFLKNQDYLLNIDIIENLQNEDPELLFLSENGCLIENHSTQLLSPICPAEAAFFDTKIDNSKIIVVHQESYRDHLIEKGYTVLSNCYQVAYVNSPFSIELPQGVEIKHLTLNHLDFVFGLYNKFVDLNYLEERIINKKMFGIFYKEQIAGFIGLHMEGAIGMLEIDKKYRRRHFATFLEKYIINKQLELSKTPYCQIIKGNEKSVALQKKLGFSFAKGSVFWMKKL